jgi:hypothetical protein
MRDEILESTNELLDSNALYGDEMVDFHEPEQRPVKLAMPDTLGTGLGVLYMIVLAVSTYLAGEGYEWGFYLLLLMVLPVIIGVIGMGYAFVSWREMSFGKRIIDDNQLRLTELTKEIKELRSLLIKMHKAQYDKVLIDFNNDIPITPHNNMTEKDGGLYFDMSLFDRLEG